MRFNRGYNSPYFVTDVKSQKVEAGAPLLIIAEDVDGEALVACILNKLRGQLQVCAIKAPGFGNNRKSILGDLAILTGGTVFTDELDIKLELATPDLFGSTGSVTVTKEDTIFLNGEGVKDAIQCIANGSARF